MTDTPAPSPVDPWSMTPAEAGAKLQEMAAAANPPPPLVPEDRQDARQRLDLLAKDASFAARLFNGDVATRKIFDDLVAADANGDPIGDILAGIEEQSPRVFETTQGGELPPRHVAEVIKSMRESGLDDRSIEQALRGIPVTRAELALTKAFESRCRGDADWCRRLLSGDFAARRDLVLMSVIFNSPVAD
jgi:hypothetical protein